jgi:hypothetical protein
MGNFKEITMQNTTMNIFNEVVITTSVFKIMLPMAFTFIIGLYIGVQWK